MVWYGQNIRTRNFGRFRRSAIHLRGERNSVSPAVMNNTSELQAAKNPSFGGSEKISKPVPGFFFSIDLSLSLSPLQHSYCD